MADADFNVKAIISAQTSQFEKGMKNAQSSLQKTSKSIEGVSKLLKSAFSVVGIGASISTITRFGKECVKSAEDANKAFNILNNTLKVTGATSWTTSEDLVKMSEDIAYSTNYTVGEIQDMQSVLLGFRNITGDTFREASDAITDMATVMGMDLKSAVQTVGKALDDPVKGLDSLRRQGFAFTEEQKKELEILVRNGEQLKAQKIILDELNTTYGGAARSAQSSFDKQKDAIISFKETLGNQLIPVLDVFAEKSATSFSTLTEKIKTIDFSEIAGTVEYSVQVITEYFGVFYNNAKELVKGLAERFGDVEISLDSVKDAIYNTLNDIYKQMQLSFGFMKALINGDWKLAWEYAKIYVLNVCKKILDGLDELLQKMPDLVNGAIKGLNKYYEAQDKVLIEWFHLPEKWFKAPRLGTYDGENYIDTTEIQKQIDEATRIIEEATGKQVTINLTGLEQIDTNRKKYQKKAEKDEIHFTSTTEVQVNKRTSIFEKEIQNIKTSWSDFVESLKKESENWTKLFQSAYESISSVSQSFFYSLGENLAGAGDGYENFASVALKALSEVLASLGAQLSALAVVKALTYSYGEAIAAAAGAAAAFTAAGVANGVANNLSKTKDQIDSIGDSANKAGKDLEYFKKRLDEILSGQTAGSRNLITTIKNLKQESQDALQAVNDAWDVLVNFPVEDMFKAYKKYNFSMNGWETHWVGTEAYKKAWKDYEDLSDIYQEISKTASNTAKNVLRSIDDTIKENEALKESYDEIYSSSWKYQEAMLSYISAIAKGNSESIKSARQRMQEYQTYMKIVLAEQKENIQTLLTDVYDQLSNTGKNIGETLVSSILNGAKKEDFMSQMKSYIRENLMKIVVYTESFQDKLAEVGSSLARALTEGSSGRGLIDMASVKSQLDELYDTASESAKNVDAMLDSIFGKVEESVEEKLTAFQKAIKSFKESIEDLGGDLASNLVEGISSGLNQSDFLNNMKDWIRKMLIQSVVYTETMKSEIEAIGGAISKGLSEGFTETTFHEIRRDLSWTFDQANRTISGIDEILNSVFGGGYATGTNNATAGLHLVGEAGPELVRFRGGEQVLNTANTQKALENNAGNVNNWTVNFNNMQDTTAYAMMNQFKQYNKQMAINGVI